MSNYDVFSEIKTRVDIGAVAERYGVQLRRGGMAICPFHNERTPSFKVFERTGTFHCFGCGTHGDAITLAQRLNNLQTPLEACKLLNSDFSLGLDLSPHRETAAERRARTQAQAEKALQRAAAKAFDDWLERATSAVTRYESLLLSWREKYKPSKMAEELHPLFAESLRELETTRFLAETLECGLLEEKGAVYRSFFRKECERVIVRIRDYENAARKS